MDNIIRTNLLLKVNSELKHVKKNNFKSINSNKEFDNDFQIEFNEFFHSKSSENGFISHDLIHRQYSSNSELDTNTSSPLNIIYFRNNKYKNDLFFSLKYLRNLSNDLKSEEIYK